MGLTISKEKATVTVKIDGEYTADQLIALIHEMGSSFSMIAATPLKPDGLAIPMVFNVPYWTQLEPGVTPPRTMLTFRHPGFGWIGFSYPVEEAARIAGFPKDQASIALGVAPVATTETPPVGGSLH